ncbi:MAG: hypothetical protein DRJ56_02195 [Thermoprotei archaeon]|nr:MAG: hypothetical protein DRJ56_02195 [Thermoprotei archaeon]
MAMSPRLSREARKSLELVRCPKCGREFSLIYARAMACWGCPRAAMSCTLVRCPYCDAEFPLESLRTMRGRGEAQSVARYLSRVVRDYE